MSKVVKYSKDVRTKMLEGVDELADRKSVV